MRAVKRRIREVQKELTLRQGFYVWLRRARRRNGSLEQYLDSVSRSGVPHVWPDLYRHAVADLPAEIRLPGTDKTLTRKDALLQLTALYTLFVGLNVEVRLLLPLVQKGFHAAIHSVEACAECRTGPAASDLAELRRRLAIARTDVSNVVEASHGVANMVCQVEGWLFEGEHVLFGAAEHALALYIGASLQLAWTFNSLLNECSGTGPALNAMGPAMTEGIEPVDGPEGRTSPCVPVRMMLDNVGYMMLGKRLSPTAGTLSPTTPAPSPTVTPLAPRGLASARRVLKGVRSLWGTAADPGGRDEAGAPVLAGDVSCRRDP